MALISSFHALVSESLAWHPLLTLGGVFVFVLVIWTLVSTVRQYWRLRHFKGPPVAAFSIWWQVKKAAGPRLYLDLWEVNQKYGPIARVGPNDLVTSDMGLIKRTLAARTEYTRSDYYKTLKFNPIKDSVVSYRDEKEHIRMRSKLAPGYAGKEVENLEKKIDENILRFVGLLRKYATANKPLDFGRKAQYFTLDVISDVAFGNGPMGFTDNDSDMWGYIKMNEANLPIIIVAGSIPWLLKLFEFPLFKTLLPSSSDRLGFGRLMGIAKDVAAERFGPDAKVQKDMLGSFIAHGVTQEEAEVEIILQIVAGSDTTAIAIRCTMLYLLTNHLALSRLRAEIAATKITRPVIADTEARSMRYLQAVIKEGLRMLPPITGLSFKQTPAQGDTYNGAFIPGGTRLGYSLMGVVRDKKIWGEDAGEFRPERWLDSPPAQLLEMESAVELVFAWGRYQCLGRPIAMIELNKIFVELLTRFDLVVCDPTKPWKSHNGGSFQIWDFWLRAYERDET